ncbi:MAG: MBL fold metallo-hydrolase, partial [Bacteroidales bacterium]
MKVTFLGTGTSLGVPIIGCDCPVCTSTDPRDNRLRTSALIQYGHLTLLIDAGPDFRQQMIRNHI